MFGFFKKKIPYKLLHENAKAPTRGSGGAAAYDFYTPESFTIEPRGKAVVKTGVAMEIPKGRYLRLESRSGLSAKHSIEKGAGIIDEDYILEIGVILYNHSDVPVHFVTGDRICQGIFQKYEVFDFIEVDTLKPKSYSNRFGGFGHTGR